MKKPRRSSIDRPLRDLLPGPLVARLALEAAHEGVDAADLLHDALVVHLDGMALDNGILRRLEQEEAALPANERSAS